jgi:hypothetical protein
MKGEGGLREIRCIIEAGNRIAPSIVIDTDEAFLEMMIPAFMAGEVVQLWVL